MQEIGWAHNRIIMEKCNNDLEREFYIKMTKKYGWTKNVLIHQIEGQSYEQFLLNQTNFDKTVPEKYKNQAKLAVKDEYNFDFLDSVLNDWVKLEDENPSIGIIVCKSKDKTVVEYALKDTNKPIGISTYKISKTLPKKLKKYLLTPDEIIRKLETIE